MASISKLALDSRAFPVWQASIFSRSSGWTASARRRRASQAQHHLAADNVFELILHNSRNGGASCVRSWIPESPRHWCATDNTLWWENKDLSYLIGIRGGAPEITSGLLSADRNSSANTVLIIILARGFLSPADQARLARQQYGPPPPPAAEEESSGGQGGPISQIGHSEWATRGAGRTTMVVFAGSRFRGAYV